MEGWISLHRKLLENPIFLNADLLQLFIYCLLKATHKEKEFIFDEKMEKLQIGEFITGRKSISRDIQQNQSSIYKRLKILEKLGYISTKSNNKYTVVKVLKFDLYQNDISKKEQPGNNQVTTREQPGNTNNNDNNINNYNNYPSLYAISEKSEEEDFIEILSESELKDNIDFKTLSVGIYKELKRIHKDKVNVLEVAAIYKNAKTHTKTINPRNYILRIASTCQPKTQEKVEESIMDGIIK